MNETLSFGSHSLVFEAETGFVRMNTVGEMSATEATQIAEALTARLDPTRPAFLLFDNTRAAALSAEARKAFSQHGKFLKLQTYMSIFGGSFAFRAMVNLLLKALSFTGQKLHGGYHPDEASARAWLTEQKQVVEAKLPHETGKDPRG